MQKLQNCDLGVMMAPLKIVREDTRISKADLQRLYTRLLEESSGSNFVDGELFYNVFTELFGQNTANHQGLYEKVFNACLGERQYQNLLSI